MSGRARPHGWLTAPTRPWRATPGQRLPPPWPAGLSLSWGAGAALPALVAARRGAASLDLADFNPSVLERLTAVNVRAEAGAGSGGGRAVRYWAGDWRGLPGALLGGGGSSKGAAAAAARPPPWALILAAEVTYAPASLAPFLACLAACLGADSGGEGGAKAPLALVAAKRYYFGVGGGSGDLVAGAVEAGLEAGVVASTGGGGGGVEVPIDVVAVRVRRRRG